MDLSAFAHVKFCHLPSVSPDGSRVAFVSNLDGSPQAWVMALAGGFPFQVTALADQVREVSWSPDGGLLALAVAPGGGMNSQVWVVRPDGGGLRMLTAGGKETNRLGAWLPDGRALTFTSNLREPRAMDAYVVPVGAGRPRLVAEAAGTGQIIDVSSDGRLAIWHQVVRRGDGNLVLLELDSGDTALLTPHDEPSSYPAARFAPDGRSMYVAYDEGRELAALGRITLDVEGPSPIELLVAKDDAQLEEIALSPAGGPVALLWNQAGRSRLELFDPAGGLLAAGEELPEVVHSLSCGRFGRAAAVDASGPADPTNVWVVDLSGGRAGRLTDSPHPGLDLSRLCRPRLVRLKAHDGLELSGWLYQPAGFEAPGPTVLNFHGGPEAQERPAFSARLQALLAAGIAVFAPNVRGSAGFGKTFVHLDDGPLRVDAVRDIEACAKHLLDGGQAAAGRLGIMGGSYGGYMTMAGITEFPELFAAAANLFGIVNFETFFAHSEPWMGAISKVEYGDPQTQAEMLRKLSPIHRINRVKTPTLVLHGANDTNVPVIEAEQVVKGLRASGVPVELVLFPDEGHGFYRTHNVIRANQAIVDWFQRWLAV